MLQYKLQLFIIKEKGIVFMLSKEDEKFLELYSDSIYEKPSVTVDAVIFRLFDKPQQNYRKLPEKKLQVYLTKRKYSPFKDMYSIVGTFIDLKNELSESMQCCVKQKVGLENNYYYEQLFTFGNKNRDPRNRVLSVSYMLLTNQDTNIQNGEWFDIDIKQDSTKRTQTQDGYVLIQNYTLMLKSQDQVLSSKISVKITKNGIDEQKNVEILQSDLAFDHSRIIFYAIERLKNKLEYTDIIFNLLPKKFTLTELKNSYEVILREKLLDANFRRKTSKLVCAIDEYQTGKGHRTSQLYKHNNCWNIDID